MAINVRYNVQTSVQLYEESTLPKSPDPQF